MYKTDKMNNSPSTFAIFEFDQNKFDQLLFYTGNTSEKKKKKKREGRIKEKEKKINKKKYKENQKGKQRKKHSSSLTVCHKWF